MKKILTVLTAVLVLCGVMFSMASCFGGDIDMTELKTELETLDKSDNNIVVTYKEGTEETNDKAILKRYYVSMKVGSSELDRDSLYIVEFANEDLAKLYYKQYKLELDYSEKYIELEKDMNEALVEIGEKTSDVDEIGEYVIERKGTVVIYGDESVYDKVFEK